MTVTSAARMLVSEALAGVGARPARLLVSVLGTVVGIGALVMTIGLGQTAAGQVATRFDAVAATHIEVRPETAAGADGKDHAAATLPSDSLDRVAGLAGVESAALIAAVPLSGETVSAVLVHDPSAASVASPELFAASGDVAESVGGSMRSGRFFDGGHEKRADRVVVLGRDAAEKLGVRGVQNQPAVFVGAHAYTVIGILGGATTQRSLLAAAIIPMSTAARDFRLRSADTLVLRNAVGASQLVAHQVPIALDPNAPENFAVASAASGNPVQGAVRGDLDLVFFVIGVIILIAGGVGIANVTMLSVSERTGEIGLRRTLGATRGQIAAQFMIESVVVGFLGGLIGAALGVTAVVVVSVTQGWTPVLDTLVTAFSTIAGGAVGLIAGGYPALSAARIEPADALRDSPG
jgi:putative ABC transport system permease protein